MSQTDILTKNRTDGAINTAYIYIKHNLPLYKILYPIYVYIVKVKLFYV